MGKRDKTIFNWEEPSTNYYETRIKSLTEQLQNAQNKCERLTSYVERLEAANAELNEKCKRLGDAFLDYAIR